MLKTTVNQLLQRVRGVQKQPHAPLAHAALDLSRLNVWNGHMDYTKFIILGRSRSGSNFLRGLLNSHSQVTAFGELFQHNRAISWGLDGYPNSPRLLALFQRDPVEFLESQIFRRQPRSIQAVGFKLFYYHAHEGAWQALWDYLAARPQIKVLHIRRTNLLQVHLSRKKAVLTDRWVNTTGAREQETPIYLDYDECLADFEQTRAWEAEYSQFFARHAVLDVCYEALARDTAREMLRVQNFLGITPESLKPETFRQSHRPLWAAIANYHELKEQFAGTPWQTFFEE